VNDYSNIKFKQKPITNSDFGSVKVEVDAPPFVRAAIENDTEKAKSLIQDGSDINQVDSDQCSALIWAAINGNTELGEYLIDAKADLN